ncbi:MAG: ATP-dependent RecD-like DNA helicase [Streptococcaceae bacterium]|jgi:exodeoxyribonuclease V alpha subunit|nr:ATP-dependent RecD-like DNA helicase [Streptococcaceae bacterium]
MDERLFFSGKIETIFFSNPTNFYKVLLLEIDETNSESFGDSEIVVTGTIGEVIEGDEDYVFYGRLTNHPKYGEQLVVDTYERKSPTSTKGLIKYLSSDNFLGIGKETAKKIVNAYPQNTVDSILENSDKLNGILNESKKDAFIKNLATNHGTETILSKLYSYGLTGRLAAQVYKAYQADSLNILKENPYQLVEDIEGIGFLTADKIAAETGIKATYPERLKAALLHCVKEQPSQTGDTYIEHDLLLIQAKELLESSRQVEISQEDLETDLVELIQDEKLLETNGKIFDKLLAQAEEGIAANITRILKRSKEVLSESEFEEAIAAVEKKHNLKYDRLQKQAIHDALENPFFILTGGPGTGKTTILNGFLEVFAQLNNLSLLAEDYTNDMFPFVLAAPTGRASRRLSELTGLPAATLHRTLGINTDDEDDDLANDLSGQVLIVDEFSMVDTWLANKLFNAIHGRMKVLIVGDADQLASVGPGQVLTDLLAFEDIPSLKLDKIYRQSENSTITHLAHSIKDGQLPVDFASKKADRNFFPANSYQVSVLISQIAISWQKRGNDPFAFQVLIPMYKGPAGITAINKQLQDIFNPKAERLEFSFMDGLFRENDKVLQLVNDAENNVFNGDIGRIIELIPAKYSDSKQDELIIDFDGQELNYMRSDWTNIRLAYAMSIHKSQGSEFETVIVPLVSSYSRMLQRNLLYTAITRARNSLILLGEVTAFEAAVAKEGANRKTSLLERLMTYTGKIPAQASKNNNSIGSVHSKTVEESFDTAAVETNWLSREMIDNGTFDPMIGLSKVDFDIFLKTNI